MATLKELSKTTIIREKQESKLNQELKRNILEANNHYSQRRMTAIRTSLRRLKFLGRNFDIKSSSLGNFVLNKALEIANPHI